MILAIKDEKAYYYNTIKEKEEILQRYKNPIYRVFTNNDKDYAKIFAESDKVSGFCTDEMNNYEILKELKNEGIQIAKFIDNSSFYRFVILNNTYCLNSNYYLEYDRTNDIFEKAVYRGYSHNAVNNMCRSIYYFADCKGLSTIDAAYQYFMKYNAMFGSHPWTTLYSSYVSYNNSSIHFEYTMDDILVINEKEKYKFKLKNTHKEDVKKDSDISNISEEPIYLSFKDEKILEAIQAIFTLY